MVVVIGGKLHRRSSQIFLPFGHLSTVVPRISVSSSTTKFTAYHHSAVTMTKMSRGCLLLLCGVVGVIQGQELKFDEDPSLSHVERNAQVVVEGFVDTEACYTAMESAVATKAAETGDRRMDGESYVSFVQSYGPDEFLANVTDFADLPLILQSNFNILACLCQTNSSDTCCVGNRAGIETDGSFSEEIPTSAEQSYLFLVCSLTSVTIDRVLQSGAPTSTPTISPEPASAPTASPAPTGQSSEAPGGTNAETVVTKYGISIRNGTATFEEYSPYLISAMNSLAPEVLQSIQRRQLRHGRRLQSVLLPTSISDHQGIGMSGVVDQRVLCLDSISLIQTCRPRTIVQPSFSCFPLTFAILVQNAPPQ